MKRLFKTVNLLSILFTFIFGPVHSLAGGEDRAAKFANQFELSGLLRPKTMFLGYIEPKYRRLKIEFASVSKSPSNPAAYLVAGSATTGNNTCKFSGSITINEVNEFPKMHFGLDDGLKNSGMRSQGELIGAYEFKEEKKEKLCGVFIGTMTLYWYIDKNGKILYDDIESYSDSYKNNQYKGKWTAYGGTEAKTANWGEHRIPDSDDLDVGGGEFGVNPKYLKQGWEDFVR